jgi:hypothetical protein
VGNRHETERRVVTIRVNAQDPEQTIRASVHGLGREGRDAGIDRMHREALNLIAVRTWHRRFRAPVEVHFLPEESGAHTLVGLVEAKDSRGRKASVKIKISGLAWQRRGKNAPATP